MCISHYYHMRVEVTIMRQSLSKRGRYGRLSGFACYAGLILKITTAAGALRHPTPTSPPVTILRHG